MPLYFLVALFILLRDNYAYYLGILILSITAILFVQNIDVLLTSKTTFYQGNLMKKYEPFYELSGLFVILTIIYLKLKQ